LGIRAIVIASKTLKLDATTARTYADALETTFARAR